MSQAVRSPDTVHALLIFLMRATRLAHFIALVILGEQRRSRMPRYVISSVLPLHRLSSVQIPSCALCSHFQSITIT